MVSIVRGLEGKQSLGYKVAQYFLRLTSRFGQVLTEPLIWHGRPGSELFGFKVRACGWRTETQAEETGFVGVPRYSSADAYRVKEELERGGLCGDLEVSVADDGNRQLYVLFRDSGGENGDWVPHLKLVADGYNRAKDAFDTLIEPADRGDYMTKHIKDAICREWEKEIASLSLAEVATVPVA